MGKTSFDRPVQVYLNILSIEFTDNTAFPYLKGSYQSRLALKDDMPVTGYPTPMSRHDEQDNPAHSLTRFARPTRSSFLTIPIHICNLPKALLERKCSEYVVDAFKCRLARCPSDHLDLKRVA